MNKIKITKRGALIFAVLSSPSIIGFVIAIVYA